MLWSAERFTNDFPGLENILIRYTERGRGVAAPNRFTTGARLHEVKEFGPDVGCSDPDCIGGGYRFTGDIQQMLMRGENVKSGESRCAGTRGTPKLRKNHGPCLNTIEYEIEIRESVAR